MQRFSASRTFNHPVEKLFDWHERAGAFERLNPPWEPVTVVEKTGGIQNGAQVHIKVPMGPLKISWRLEHVDYIQHQQFCDQQISGPFRYWKHTHKFSKINLNTSSLDDSIEYSLQPPIIGDVAGGWFVKQKLRRLFEYRHSVTQNDLDTIKKYSHTLSPGKKILISGASGLVGKSLAAFLSCAGHEISTLVRRTPKHAGEIFWNPNAGDIDAQSMEGFDYIIHLAGENIGQRWSKARKEQILRSRVDGTKLLVDTLTKVAAKPTAFLSASAIGIYGNQGDSECIENSPNGSGFLVDVCKLWESPLSNLEKLGIRTISLRFGIALSPAGGALHKMLLPFKLGVGGIVGTGTQYMSWIALDDLIYAIYHCMGTQTLSGPVNITAPTPVTNHEFTATLAKTLRRPAFFPVPAFVLRTLFGQMADEALLSSTRALPDKLTNSHFTFRFGSLRSALQHQLP